MESRRDGILGQDVKRWAMPRIWVLICATLLLFGWFGVISGILSDRSPDIVTGAILLLIANWWWRRRTRKLWSKAHPGLPVKRGLRPIRFIQAFYQPLLAVVWDLRNWF